MIGLHTQMAQGVGQVAEGISQVASLDQGGSPLTFILAQIGNTTNASALAIVAVIYALCVIYTAIWSRKQYKEWEEELAQG